MVRSKNYFNYINPLFNLLGNFVNLYFLNIDIITIIKREYEKGVYGIDNPYYIAYEIDNGNQKVIDLTYNNMKAIFISNNKELVELTGKLLLAAKLQEGVRQQICENMDGGLQENFEYMFKIIYDEGRKIVDYLVQNELKRGDSPTKYSELLHGIKRIEGIDYLVQILQALGKETLDRAAYYWEEMILKNLCLVIY